MKHFDRKTVCDRWTQWLERHVIMDDPRSVAEQMRDELSPERSGILPIVLVFMSAAVWAVALYMTVAL